MLALLVACSSSQEDSADTADVDAIGIDWYADMMPIDLTPDGSVALFQSATSLEGELFLLEDTNLRSVTTLGDATKNIATGVSADARVSALHGLPVQAGVWSEADGWTDLASPFESGCDVDDGGAFDISDDGGVVVGLLWDGCVPAAFRWTAAGGVALLDTLGEGPDGGPPTNRATVVSGDGQVAAGFAAYGAIDRSPARWEADGAGELLAPEDTDQPGEVLSIDYDGSTLGVQRGYDGYVWTAEGFVALGRVDTALPTDPVYPNALTPDGAVAFGGVGSEFFGVPVAFVWTAEAGMRPLQTLATEAGVAIPDGWALTSVMAVSDDGTVLLGRAFDAEMRLQAFVMRVPSGTWRG